MFSASLDFGLQSLRRLVRTGSSLNAVLLIAVLPASSSTVFASASPDRAEPASITTVEPPPGWSAPIAVTVPGMQNPNDLAVDPYLGRLYITSRSNDHVLMLDTNTRQVVGSSPVGDMPWGVAVNPSSHRVYIANFGSDTLTVLNSQTLAHVATINLGTGARPTFVRVLSNQKVIVVLYGMSGFAVIDAEHNALERLVTTNRPGACWGWPSTRAAAACSASFRRCGCRGVVRWREQLDPACGRPGQARLRRLALRHDLQLRQEADGRPAPASTAPASIPPSGMRSRTPAR